MIPKKLLFFALIVAGGLAYLLQGKSLNDLQPGVVKKDLEKRRELKKLKKDPMALEKQKRKEAQERGHRFMAGECISNSKDGWEFTKIISVGDHEYKIIDCHKFKGCTQKKSVSWRDIEFEYRQGKTIPCSR